MRRGSGIRLFCEQYVQVEDGLFVGDAHHVLLPAGEAWVELNPESISASNKWRIDNYDKLWISPKIDQTWIDAFPEHADFRGQPLVHHPVDQGRYAIPLPQSTLRNSPGFGIWHD